MSYEAHRVCLECQKAGTRPLRPLDPMTLPTGQEVLHRPSCDQVQLEQGARFARYPETYRTRLGQQIGYKVLERIDGKGIQVDR